MGQPMAASWRPGSIPRPQDRRHGDLASALAEPYQQHRHADGQEPPGGRAGLLAGQAPAAGPAAARPASLMQQYPAYDPNQWLRPGEQGGSATSVARDICLVPGTRHDRDAAWSWPARAAALASQSAGARAAFIRRLACLRRCRSRRRGRQSGTLFLTGGASSRTRGSQPIERGSEHLKILARRGGLVELKPLLWGHLAPFERHAIDDAGLAHSCTCANRSSAPGPALQCGIGGRR